MFRVVPIPPAEVPNPSLYSFFKSVFNGRHDLIPWALTFRKNNAVVDNNSTIADDQAAEPPGTIDERLKLKF